MGDAPVFKTKNDLIQQVMGLIHLATHTERKEESLSAALAAVRIIDEYKLQFVSNNPKIQVVLPSSRPVMSPIGACAVAVSRPEPVKHRIRLTSKFDTHCQECGDEIETGDTCWWLKGEGCLCEGCYGEDDE